MKHDACGFLIIADDKAYKVKLSQSHNDLVSMPLKLLSIGIEEVPETGASASSEEGASSGSLEDYVINSATMQMWGYPLPLVGTNRENTFAKDDQSPIASTVVDIDDSTEPLVKRIRTESVVVTSSIEVITTTADASTVSCVSSNTEAIEGVTVGVVPTIADTVAITASVPLVGATVKVRNGVQLEGFIETLPTSSTGFRELFRSAVDVTEAPKVVAVDCEMCDTSEGLELTRLTLMDDCNRVLFDSYVKPDREITNYRTQFSGINSELMAKVTVTHAQAQIAFLRLVAAETILVGHSLDSDLKALKIIHRRCVDTSVLYPHSKGFPYRLKLKSLAEQYLKQKIQRDAGGHSSIEDAKAAMQLAKLKAQNGPDFGVKSPDHMREPLISQVSNSSFKAGFFWLAADNATGSAAVPPTATTTATGTLSGFSTSLAEQSEEQRLLMTCCVGGRYHQHNKPVVVDNSSTDTVQLLSQVSTFYQSPLRATSETLDMSLCYVSITQHALQRSSTAAVFKEQLLTIAGSGTLLLVTAQPTSQQVVALRAQKAACSKPMTMATWTPEQEIRLKESLAVHNFGRVWFFTK